MPITSSCRSASSRRKKRSNALACGSTKTAASRSTPISKRAGEGIFAVGDVHGDIKLIAVAWAEGIQAAIHAFKEITSPYWLNEKRLRDHKIALIGEKISRAARSRRKPA